MQLLCPWEPAQYFFFSSNVPTLLYYSHLTAVLAATLFALVLIPQVRNSLPIKLFLATIFFFTAWTVIDVSLWASNQPSIVLFYWSIQILFEMFLYVSALYFAYVFVIQKDLNFLPKSCLAILLTPILILLPTSYLLSGMDVSSCNAVESSFVIWYTYSVEMVLSFLILFVSFWGIRTQPARKMEIVLFTTGLIVFLIAFSSGNIVGSITDNWNLAQVGLFGMPVFIAFLAYTVVKFKSFNTKLFAAQALVWAQGLLILALLFIRDIQYIQIIIALTLVLTVGLGYRLVRSVKKEIESKEALAETASLITHQIRGVFANTKAGLSTVIEGDFGAVSPGLMDVMNGMFKSQVEGVKEVEAFLQAQKIENGTIQYDNKPFDLKEVVEDKFSQEKPRAESKGLQYELQIYSGDYVIGGDQIFLTQVIVNLIDNAIRYTEKGSIEVQLSRKTDTVLYSVKDSGVGITDEDKIKMFTKYGHGKDSRKINAASSGLGLYIVKGIVDGHGGKIWYDTEIGKGTTFFVELPIKQTAKK